MINKAKIEELKLLCRMYQKQLSDLQNELKDSENEKYKYSCYYKHIARTKRLGLMLRQEMIEAEKEMKR